MRFYKADTRAPGGFRRLETKSVAQAKRWGYVPSVTSILGVIRSPHIEEYLIRQCLDHYCAYQDFKAALTFRDSKSADFGTVCHALLEAHLTGQKCAVEHDRLHEQACEPLWRWIDEMVEEVLFTEQPFADSELGYGGTADLLVLMKDGRQTMLDLKTKRNSPRFPMNSGIYEHYQLSAYRRHFQKDYGPMSMGNLFIASPYGYLPKPTLRFVDYGDDDWIEGFDAAHLLWRQQHEIV